jgi:RNA polymerase sigma-70 factor (ECF subfamily)
VVDAALITRLQAGDEEAFRQLVRDWQGPVLNFVYRMTADAAGAEDLAQEVFVRVARSIGRFRYRPGRAAFSTWLFQIARNAALDRLRHRARHPEESLEAREVAAGELPGRVPSPDVAAGHNELAAEIAAAVASLPEDQRTALVLAEYEGLPVTEIAAVMACSAKSVESRLYRARQALRSRLAHRL